MDRRRPAIVFGIIVTAILLISSPEALAQDSHWGVAASITPAPTPATQFESLPGLQKYDLEGAEFTIGLARGREQGGDWAISFLRKNVKDGSTVEGESEEECFEGGCTSSSEIGFTRNVKLNALEVRKSLVFGTISRRVQIGIDFAGGIGKFSGELERHFFFSQSFENPFTGETDVFEDEQVEIQPAEEILPISVVPLGRLHAAVGVIVAPGVKVRVSGGIGFPMNHVFTITGVYLFGAE
jgi:hypothetical protein